MKTSSFLRKPLNFEGMFTQVPNAWARDERLGYRAKGILLLLMSHKDGWKISLEHLASDSPDGITAIRTAIEQLTECGYLTRTIIRNDKNQIEGAEWILSDPFAPESDFLKSENQLENQSENLKSENHALKKKIIKEDNRKELESFEDFWRAYPRKVAKGAALKAFEKALKKSSAQEIISAVHVWVQSGRVPEMQYIPYPATWLNQARWQDDINGLAAIKNSTTIAADIMNRASALEAFNQRAIE